MTEAIRVAKTALRREVLARIRGASAAEREEGSRLIREAVLKLDEWQNARSVMLFCSMPDEPDIAPLIPIALAAGKVVALPRYDVDNQLYTAANIEDVGRDCRPGHFGILEPVAGCKSISLMQLDLILVPGVCFDLNGRRLGRGKGYYDRLLAQVHGTKCGLAFAWQIVSEVPVEPHDVQLNCILTPTRCHKV